MLLLAPYGRSGAKMRNMNLKYYYYYYYEELALLLLLFFLSLKVRVAMRFTAETHGFLKCKISPLLT